MWLAYKLMRYKKYIYIEEENLKKRGRGLGNIKGFFSYIGKSYNQALKRWKEKKTMLWENWIPQKE